jgi:hypothetical protein
VHLYQLARISFVARLASVVAVFGVSFVIGVFVTLAVAAFALVTAGATAPSTAASPAPAPPSASFFAAAAFVAASAFGGSALVAIFIVVITASLGECRRGQWTGIDGNHSGENGKNEGQFEQDVSGHIRIKPCCGRRSFAYYTEAGVTAAIITKFALWAEPEM